MCGIEEFVTLNGVSVDQRSLNCIPDSLDHPGPMDGLFVLIWRFLSFLDPGVCMEYFTKLFSPQFKKSTTYPPSQAVWKFESAHGKLVSTFHLRIAFMDRCWIFLDTVGFRDFNTSRVWDGLPIVHRAPDAVNGNRWEKFALLWFYLNACCLINRFLLRMESWNRER